MAALPHAYRDHSRLGPDLAYNRLPAESARVFRLLLVHPGPDVSAAAVAALVGLPVSESHGALSCLAQAQLVEAVPGSRERWRMRDPARPHAQRLSDARAADDGREQARDRLLDYYLIATEAADDRLRGLPPIPVPQEFTDRKGALAWLDTERASLIAVVQMAADTGRDYAAKSLPLLLAQYLGFRARFDDLLAISTIGLNAARRLGDRTAESDALTNLGLALWGLRRYDEAVIVQQDSAAIFRENGDHHGQAHTLNNLGLALHGLHRNDEAVTAHRDAATIYRKTGDNRGEGNALNNLGLALRALQQFADAAKAHRDAAAIYRKTGDRHSIAMALGNLGNVLRELGRHEEAVATYQETADIFRETGDRPRELVTLENLTAAREAI
jgi:tetratricopeptide (TPR) repeat protein